LKLRSLRLGALLALVASVSACRQDMHDQPRFKAYGANSFFADKRNNRQLVPGTVARGRLYEDDHLHRGKVDGKVAETFPFEITNADLERGQQRYQIYCLPCHGMVGDGNGMAVQRGMRRPPSYHIERLQKAPPGYVFDVITNGFGAMFDYSERIHAEDRWRIVAYVKTLQFSQNATLAEVPEPERPNLDKPKTVATTPGHSSATHETQKH
jgi:hypothetical protein